MTQTLQSHVEGSCRGIDPLQGLLAARGADDAFLAPEAFSRTVDLVEAEVEKLEVVEIRGASEIGHVLAGALMDRTKGRLRLWTPGSPGAVLLLDGVLAGGAGLSSVAFRMKKLGAGRVSAIVLGTVESSLAAPAGIDALVRIAEEPLGRVAALPKAA